MESTTAVSRLRPWGTSEKRYYVLQSYKLFIKYLLFTSKRKREEDGEEMLKNVINTIEQINLPKDSQHMVWFFFLNE